MTQPNSSKLRAYVQLRYTCKSYPERNAFTN